MIASLKIRKSEAMSLRGHYERVAHDNLQILWHRKVLIFAIVVAAVCLVSPALVLIGPWYTSEAMIQLDFNRQARATADNKIEQAAVTVEAVALVDTAARIIRSRATASAVVTRLGLDKDPDFTRGSLTWPAVSKVRVALDLAGPIPTPHDLAANALMRKMAVTNDSRA
jgi:uncharacterized protein involved in exopolysaccharide biosynthesis